jgi:hypothetical protein
MKLCDLDEAVTLINYRKNCEELRRCAESGFIELRFTGCSTPESHISLDCVREAVKKECDRVIAEYEAKLNSLGVEV